MEAIPLLKRKADCYERLAIQSSLRDSWVFGRDPGVKAPGSSQRSLRDQNI